VEEVRQASVGHVVVDEQLLLLAVVVRDEREEVGVAEPAQPAHVLLEVLPPHTVHLLEPLHHDGVPARERRAVAHTQVGLAQHLRRRLEQVLQLEEPPAVVAHVRQPSLLRPLTHRAAAAAAPVLAAGSGARRDVGVVRHRRRRWVRVCHVEAGGHRLPGPEVLGLGLAPPLQRDEHDCDDRQRTEERAEDAGARRALGWRLRRLLRRRVARGRRGVWRRQRRRGGCFLRGRRRGLAFGAEWCAAELLVA
jgi:hypothetical protein